jgi:hypothetical protein
MSIPTWGVACVTWTAVRGRFAGGGSAYRESFGRKWRTAARVMHGGSSDTMLAPFMEKKTKG